MGFRITDSLSWKESDDAVTFTVKVIPRANRDEIYGVENGALKVRVNAPPVEGKANDRLAGMLSDLFKVRKGNVEILRGQTGRLKTVRVHGIRAVALMEALKRLED